jgi:hypothetical protein
MKDIDDDPWTPGRRSEVCIKGNLLFSESVVNTHGPADLTSPLGLL